MRTIGSLFAGIGPDCAEWVGWRILEADDVRQNIQPDF